MGRTGFRLRVSVFGRLARSAVLVLGLVLFVPAVLSTGLDPWVRVFGAVSTLLCLVGLRILWGSVVVVRPKGLRVQRNWPLRRDFRWYRILSIDVIPGFWHLEIELNSGERVTLPAVDDLERLYQLMEYHRQALDA
ncbi:MAG TPA: PH domain-containing protein [Acidimicrobiales bacterium]